MDHPTLVLVLKMEQLRANYTYTQWSNSGSTQPESYRSAHHGVTQGRCSLRTAILHTMESLRAQPESCCSTHCGVTQSQHSLRTAILNTMESVRAGTT